MKKAARIERHGKGDNGNALTPEEINGTTFENQLTYVEARSGAGLSSTEAAPPLYLGNGHSRQDFEENTQATTNMDLPSAQGPAIRPRAIWNRIKHSSARSPTRQISRARRTKNTAGSPMLLRPSSHNCGRSKTTSTCRYSARLSMSHFTAQRPRKHLTFVGLVLRSLRIYLRK